MSSIWEKFILNEFMRNDIKLNSSKDELKGILKKFSAEIDKIVQSNETLEILENNLKNWSYKNKEFSIKNLVMEGIRYDVSKSVKFKKNGDKSFLTSGTQIVDVPREYCKLTEYILNKNYITEKEILEEFKNTPENLIHECLENLKNMKILV